MVDGDLNIGHTYCSETYQNIEFSGNEKDKNKFNIVSLEAYAIS